MEQSDEEINFECPATYETLKAVEDALEGQWRVVYGHGPERNLERGGLVLKDGGVNPGHFCFNLEAELSPISAIPDDQPGAGARVGAQSEVAAGWDHTSVVGSDSSTYHFAQTVSAHFHVHADLAGPVRGVPKCKPSMPSVGDISAWLRYHHNTPRAFILTIDKSWLLVKHVVPGHQKSGFKAPNEVIDPIRSELEPRRYESISKIVDIILDLRRHGFGVYQKWIGGRALNGCGVYELWPGSEVESALA
eukprot:TRINITY_DN1827_c0_g3_i1.p1 TRINITY_DN1827_c0_g3~~TRINITY_DN1827_c0_g3_i1.p1  ORF type:complete len:261 (-),score=27.22 TRINITY_DN1827_c0_g3_i1:247-993(-)